MVVKKASYMRTRRYKNNKLLKRKQFILDIYHPGGAPMSKKQIRLKLKFQFRVSDTRKIVISGGMRNKFGGGKQTAYILIYNSFKDQKKYEPKHRLIQNGLLEEENRDTKVYKHIRAGRKNFAKRFRGLEKAKKLYPRRFANKK